MRARLLRLVVVLAVFTTACANARGAHKAPPPRGSVSASKVYTVRKGDTLYGVSRQHGLSVAQVMALNGLKSHRLAVGQRLHLAPPSRGGSGKVLARQRAPAQAASQGPVAKSGAKPKAVPATAHAKAKPKPPAVAALPTPLRILRWPVQGAITSPFGTRGPHVHDGIDIGAPRGAKVVAALDGEVVYASRHGNYGNLVIVQHANGMMTIYAHHDANLVRPGQRVRTGDVIARVGATGRATGPHLHFEVRRGARPDNPMRYLLPRP